MVGSSLGLPGIWVLAAVTVGGGLLGIGGMLLGVPLAAAIYRMLGEEVNSHLSETLPDICRKAVCFPTDGLFYSLFLLFLSIFVQEFRRFAVYNSFTNLYNVT